MEQPLILQSDCIDCKLYDGVSGVPHPNAKLVAAPLKQEFIKRGYI